MLILLSPSLFAAPEPVVPGVVVARVEIRSFPLSAEALGNARANESVDIRSKITATLTAILFEEGQTVAAGDVLVKLDSLEQVADLVVFLCKEEASAITGAVMPIDGGWTAK